MILKLTLREIKKSLGRYLAIVAIVALGAGFFTGLRLTKTSMIATLDTYVQQQNFYDFRLISTLGMTQEDVDAALELPQVAEAEGCISLDLLCSAGDADGLVLKFYSLPELVNAPNLLAGRMPEATGECIADSMLFDDSAIGSTITVAADNEGETLDLLTTRTFTIVGIGASPLHINMERGSSSIGKGTVTGFLYVTLESFDVDYFTELYLTLDGKSGGIYTEEYDRSVAEAEAAIIAFCDERGLMRYERIYADAMGEINDAQAELDNGWAEYEDGRTQLDDARADAETQMADAEAQLHSGQAQLNAGQQTINSNLAALQQAQAEIDAGYAELEASQAEIDAGYAELEVGQAELDAQRAEILEPLYQQRDELEAQLEQVEAGIAQVEQTINMLTPGSMTPEEFFAALNAVDWSQLFGSLSPGEIQNTITQLTQLSQTVQQLYTARTQLQDGLAQLNAGIAQAETELAAAQAEIDAGREQLDAAQAEVDAGREQLDAAQAEVDSGYAQISNTQTQLEQNQWAIWSGYAELEDAQAQADEEFAGAEAELADAESQLLDGQTELEDARDQLDELEQPDTYTLDRSTNIGYACFDSDSSIVSNISEIFPVFFFLVSALICITTMTRMVDEQRTQIGVLKALGYSRGVIMAKFLLYSGSASLLGCIIGVALFSRMLPAIIWHAYGMMYDFSDIVYAFDWPLVLVSSAGFIACALLATWYTCSRELSQVSAELIRPKAPKAGKRVFLEYIPILWKRLGFLRKVSIRNVLRYKKRMFMMILGIGGCTALLLTAFGLLDSVKNVVVYQYGEITQYDAAVTFGEDMTEAQQDNFLQAHGQYLDSCLFTYESSLEISANNVTKTCYVVAPCCGNADGFVDMHHGSEPIAYPGDGEVVIDKKLSTNLDVRIGDTVTIRDADMRPMTLTVSGIMDQYIGSYAYITQASYEQAFGVLPEAKTAYLQFADATDVHDASTAITADDAVINVSLTEDLRSRVDNMMTSMNSIILVVILGAAALAVIVLYNLTNINITERIREIATIKVLGFYDNETASYVFRENLMLAVIGALCGLPMGIALHRFVMVNITVDGILFDARIGRLSYVLAFVLTMGFAVIVNRLMRLKLQKIHMTEALKSIE